MREKIAKAIHCQVIVVCSFVNGGQRRSSNHRAPERHRAVPGSLAMQSTCCFLCIQGRRRTGRTTAHGRRLTARDLLVPIWPAALTRRNGQIR